MLSVTLLSIDLIHIARRPSPYGQPLLFLVHRRFFKWRSSVLKLKPRALQDSLRRTSLLTNSATNCQPSARLRRFRTAVLCSPFVQPLQHRSSSLDQVRWSNVYCPTCVRSNGLRRSDASSRISPVTSRWYHPLLTT